MRDFLLWIFWLTAVLLSVLCLGTKRSLELKKYLPVHVYTQDWWQKLHFLCLPSVFSIFIVRELIGRGWFSEKPDNWNARKTFVLSCSDKFCVSRWETIILYFDRKNLRVHAFENICVVASLRWQLFLVDLKLRTHQKRYIGCYKQLSGFHLSNLQLLNLSHK